MAKHSKGFTVIEIVFAIAIIGLASILFFTQKRDLEIYNRDSTRKTAINAMYYSLEEVFYPTNGFYPRSIDSNNLKSVDPTLFTDPNGIEIGKPDSSYIYTPTNCTDDKCKSYTLRSALENEADYIKTSRNK